MDRVHCSVREMGGHLGTGTFAFRGVPRVGDTIRITDITTHRARFYKVTGVRWNTDLTDSDAPDYPVITVELDWEEQY